MNSSGEFIQPSTAISKRKPSDNFAFDDPVFSHYWKSARTSRRWLRRHFDSVNSTNDVSSPFLPPPPPPPPPIPEFLISKSQKKSKKKDDFSKRNFEKIPHENVADEVRVDEVEELKISDDILAFMTHTIKHRLERDRNKDQSETADNPSSSNTIFVPADAMFSKTFNAFGGDADAVEKMIFSKGETPAQRRRHEMLELYGEAAARIQAEETLMQMKFDQEYDKSHPPLWPNIPLKL